MLRGLREPNRIIGQDEKKLCSLVRKIKIFDEIRPLHLNGTKMLEMVSQDRLITYV